MIRETEVFAASTPELIESAAGRFGELPCIVDGGVTLSYAELLEQVRCLAVSLLDRGFAPGHLAGIWAPNCHQWIVAALAIQYAGGTLVTLNTRYKGPEAAEILKASGATWLFSVDTFLGQNYLAMLEDQDCGNLTSVITINIDPGTTHVDDFQSLLAAGRELLTVKENQEALENARNSVSSNTPSDILFTSGTTGRAKGVVTEHGQNMRAFSAFAGILGLEQGDRYLIINPFFHSFGYKAGWLAAILSGAAIFPLAVFDVDTVLTQIARHRITVLPGPPTLFQSIINHPDLHEHDLSSLAKATTGAAVIPTQLIRDMWQILEINTVLTAYGLSETCGLVTMCRPGDSADIIAGTSGRAIPDVEVGIMSEDGELLPSGVTGEIVVRGYNVMHGYLDDSDATRKTIDSNGWLHTGDAGNVDESGNLRITDRLKDMYICGGFNCYPAEIETQMMTHPDLQQVSVVGMTDERMGEVGAAFVVARDGVPVDIDALFRWCRDNMANYKVPRRIEQLDALPLNASGKVLKTQLRKHLENQRMTTGR